MEKTKEQPNDLEVEVLEKHIRKIINLHRKFNRIESKDTSNNFKKKISTHDINFHAFFRLSHS